MYKALVVGANGFLGSHLVDQLVAAGFVVTAFDRFSSRAPYFDAKEVKIIQGDFQSPSSLEAATRGQDFVFHFVSLTTPHNVQSDPTFDMRSNVMGSIDLLQACVRNDVKRFFFASTGGAIYGQQDKAVFSEENPTFPISPYGIGKLAVENYLRYFELVYGLKTVAMRISNPYGPRQRPTKGQGLIPIALRAAIDASPFTRFGDGSMVRDYIYVDDLIEMIMRIVNAEPLYRVYNLGSGSGVSVNDVLHGVREVTGLTIEIEERVKPPSFVDNVVLDTSRFRSEFGYSASTPLDAGIRKTYEAISSRQ